MDKKYLRPSEFCDYLQLSRSHLHRLERNDPQFPKRIQVSPRLVIYRKADIDEWLKSKEAKSDGLAKD